MSKSRPSVYLTTPPTPSSLIHSTLIVGSVGSRESSHSQPIDWSSTLQYQSHISPVTQAVESGDSHGLLVFPHSRLRRVGGSPFGLVSAGGDVVIRAVVTWDTVVIGCTCYYTWIVRLNISIKIKIK